MRSDTSLFGLVYSTTNAIDNQFSSSNDKTDQMQAEILINLVASKILTSLWGWRQYMDCVSVGAGTKYNQECLTYMTYPKSIVNIRQSWLIAKPDRLSEDRCS